MPLAFVPGFPSAPDGLLARFLPPLGEGVAAHYVEHYTAPGEVVLDPFGQSPRVAVEALRLGRRVIVANFNPISRLALSLAVRPPAMGELRSALTQLADMRLEANRLETYVRGLYLTHCATCGREVNADAFDWEAEVLAEKVYVCLQCGGVPQRHPVDEWDRGRASHFKHSGPDYHILLDRVTALNDPDRVHAEEALGLYPARALTAIATTLLKLDLLHPSPAQRRVLASLLVAAFETVILLGPERPKALVSPRRYTEHNFWLALENAMGRLAGQTMPDQSCALLELWSRSIGIYAHAGPVRDMVTQIPPGACRLILSAFPRPNPAYWALSAMWAAWLWGREAATALRSVLRRRRYDWAWHADAMEKTLSSLRPALDPQGQVIGLLTEAEPGLVAASLAAADRAGYGLRDAALQADTAEAQCRWEPAEASPAAHDDAQLAEVMRTAMVETVRARGEPGRWSVLHFAAWRAVAEQCGLRTIPAEPVGAMADALETVTGDTATFQRLEAEPGDEVTTGWWFVTPAAGLPPALSDRVEAFVLKRLTEMTAMDEQEVVREACAAFPGAQTPGRSLVLACLGSYGQRLEAGRWQLRPEEASAARAQESQSIQAELRALATRQGFTVAGANPQEWRDESGQTLYLFAIITSAVFSTHIFAPALPAQRRFVVLPGGRAGLAGLKLRRDPRLREAVRAGRWAFIKFRQVRRMVADAHLTRATLEGALSADPVEELKQLRFAIQG